MILGFARISYQNRHTIWNNALEVFYQKIRISHLHFPGLIFLTPFFSFLFIFYFFISAEPMPLKVFAFSKIVYICAFVKWSFVFFLWYHRQAIRITTTNWRSTRWRGSQMTRKSVKNSTNQLRIFWRKRMTAWMLEKNSIWDYFRLSYKPSLMVTNIKGKKVVISVDWICISLFYHQSCCVKKWWPSLYVQFKSKPFHVDFYGKKASQAVCWKDVKFLS